VIVDGDSDITKTHLAVYKKLPEYYFNIWAAFFGGEIGIACCLGNPFDMLQKLESSGKVKEQSLLNFGGALSVFLPSMTLVQCFSSTSFMFLQETG